MLPAARADGVNLLFHALAAAQRAQTAHQTYVTATQAADRKHAHSACRENGQQSAVFKLAHDVRSQAFGFKPTVQREPQGGVAGWQEHRQVVQRLRKLIHVGFAHMGRWPEPFHGGLHQAFACQPQVGVARCGLSGQHQVQMMQRQFGQQLLEFAFVTHQAQRGRVQNWFQQRVCGQLGNAVRQAHGQACHLAAGRFAHLIRDQLADLKYLFSARKCGLTCLAQRHTAPCRFEELVAQRLLQFAHLSADGLHRHVQPLGSTGKAAFFGDDPKIIQMAVVQHAGLTSNYQK